MKTGIANGIYTGVNDGIEQGAYTGVNTGLASGVYNENILQNAIVRNGLVLYLDAAQNLSYPRSGTIWRDLTTNNNNGTLTNGPTFNSRNGGSIVFDGVNDYLFMSSNGLNLGVNFTLQIWAKITRFGGGPFGPTTQTRAHLMANAWSYSFNEGFAFIATSQAASPPFGPTPGIETFFITIGQDQFVAAAVVGSLSSYVNNWVNLSATVNGTNPIRLFINGVQPRYANQSNGPTSILYPAKNFTIGGNINFGQLEFTQGSISQTLIYNRALTEAEVRQNYIATKSRFDL